MRKVIQRRSEQAVFLSAWLLDALQADGLRAIPLRHK